MPIDRRQDILDAARALFLHHGFPKVTLVDIAEAVGVSRPTLYQSFANKEEIYRALVEDWINQAMSRIIEGRNTTSNLNQQLTDAIGIWVVEPYEMMSDTPKSGGIADCSYEFIKPTFDIGYAEFSKQVAAILTDFGHKGILPTDELADFISVSLRGLKEQAVDRSDLHRLIDNLLALALSERA